MARQIHSWQSTTVISKRTSNSNQLRFEHQLCTVIRTLPEKTWGTLKVKKDINSIETDSNGIGHWIGGTATWEWEGKVLTVSRLSLLGESWHFLQMDRRWAVILTLNLSGAYTEHSSYAIPTHAQHILCTSRGWRNVENVPTLPIFFHGFGWPPPLPLLLYKVCFSKFWCFFVLWSWVHKNPVAIALTYLPINSWTFKSQSKMLCMQVFAWRNIHEKLLNAVSFTSIYITFNIIIGIGVAKVSALNDRNFRQSIHFPMVADANGGFSTATGMTKCTPPLHRSSLTQMLLDPDFWIQRGSNL